MSQYKLPADASRILFVRHLPDAITHEELYELFGRFGAVEQIRLYVLECHETHFIAVLFPFPLLLYSDSFLLLISHVQRSYFQSRDKR